MTRLSSLTYPQLLRSFNQPADASHVLDHFNGDYNTFYDYDEEGNEVFTLGHCDEDIDSTRSQEHARNVLLWKSDDVGAFLRAKGDDALDFLLSLGFTKYDAGCKCWNAGIHSQAVREAITFCL